MKGRMNMRKLIVLSLVYKETDALLKISKNVLQPAANTFQRSMLRGIKNNAEFDLTLINCVPVGSWPLNNKKIWYGHKEHFFDGIRCIEVPFINLPVIKQISRYINTKRILKTEICKETEVLIYSTYLPYLKAVSNDSRIATTVIVTDIPEYYDLQKTSFIKKIVREVHNKLVYKYLIFVKRFVVLTEAMKVPLHINKRPYIVVEGICDTNIDSITREKEPHQKVVFYSGTLSYKFGIMDLVHSVQAMKSDDVQLWICGTGEAKTEIEKIAKDDNRIKYYGFCSKEKVNELRSKASVLVNPRKNNDEYTKYSFPSKTMEYLMSGIPVVMYKLDGIPSDYNEYIHYVDDTDSNGLMHAIEKVLQIKYEDRIKEGKVAHEYVKNNKSENVQAKRIINFINEN